MAGFDLGGLLSSGIGIFGGGSPRVDPNAGGFMDALNTAHQQQVAAKTYADAAMDPSSAWFKNLSSLYEDTNRANLITGLNAFFNQRQQRAARGIPMNSERVDEAGARAAARANWEASEASRGQAQSALLKGAQMAQGGAAGLGSFYDTILKVAQGNAQGRATQTGRIFDVLGGMTKGIGIGDIMGLFGSGAGGAGGAGSAMGAGVGADAAAGLIGSAGASSAVGEVPWWSLIGVI